MYYNNGIINDDIINSIEELVMDFLMYRKQKKGRSMYSRHAYSQSASQAYGKVPYSALSVDDMLISDMLDAEDYNVPQIGMPNASLNYKDETNFFNDSMDYENNFFDFENTLGYENESEMIENCEEDFDAGNNCKNHNERNQKNLTTPSGERELEYIKYVFTETNKVLYPFVVSVINEYQYTNSPIYDEYVDKETIQQIVDQVIDMALSSVPELETIQPSEDNNYWSIYRILRSAVESLVLFRLFVVRRERNEPIY